MQTSDSDVDIGCRHQQRLHDQLLGHAGIQGVAHQFAVEQVLDAGKVKPTLIGGDVSDVRHLRPIAGVAPFLQARELVRRVNAEGCIELDTNAYSVPWRLIGETVTVIVSADTVVVEYAGEEVARHAQLSGSRGRSIERSHLLGGSPPPAEIEAPSPTDALLRPLAEYEAIAGGAW